MKKQIRAMEARIAMIEGAEIINNGIRDKLRQQLYQLQNDILCVARQGNAIARYLGVEFDLTDQIPAQLIAVKVDKKNEQKKERSKS
jgi:hypothetical protein